MAPVSRQGLAGVLIPRSVMVAAAIHQLRKSEGSLIPFRRQDKPARPVAAA